MRPSPQAIFAPLFVLAFMVTPPADAWQISNATQEELSVVTVVKGDFGVDADFWEFKADGLASYVESGPKCPIGIVLVKGASADDLKWQFHKLEEIREHEWFRGRSRMGVCNAKTKLCCSQAICSKPDMRPVRSIDAFEDVARIAAETTRGTRVVFDKALALPTCDDFLDLVIDKQNGAYSVSILQSKPVGR